MKTGKILALVAICALIFAYACRKDKESLVTDLPVNSNIIEQAKIFYGTKVKKENLSSALLKKIEKSQPEWDASSETVQEDGTRLILTKYPDYKISSNKWSYRRSYLFVQNRAKIQEGFIVEIFGDNEFLEKNYQKILANYNRESFEGFNGRILVYDLEYHLIVGRIFKDGKSIAGRANIGKKSQASPKSATPVTQRAEGQCTAYYLVTTYYDAYGQAYDQTWEFLYMDCGGSGGGPGDGGGGSPGGETLVYDCYGTLNGTAYMAACGCIRGETGIPACPKDPCVERQNVSARAASAAVSSQKSTIISNSTSVEWGTEQNINAWPGGTSYNNVAARAGTASNSFTPTFVWNATDGYTLGAAHGHPGGTGPSPRDVFWMYDNLYNSQLVAAGPDAKNYYQTNVSITTYTPNGTTYVVQINDWAGILMERQKFMLDNTGYNNDYIAEAQNYMFANNSTDNGTAGIWALMSLMGDKIRVYKAEPGSDTFEPLEKIGFTVQGKPCYY